MQDGPPGTVRDLHLPGHRDRGLASSAGRAPIGIQFLLPHPAGLGNYRDLEIPLIIYIIFPNLDAGRGLRMVVRGNGVDLREHNINVRL